MRKHLQIVLLLVACFGTTNAVAAGHVKMGAAKGETAGKPTPPSPGHLKKKTDTAPAALLLPAVQAAREAATAPSRQQGKVEFEWKVEEGQ